jgi:hypothetical protein
VGIEPEAARPKIVGLPEPVKASAADFVDMTTMIM